jgi:hypothetical protein
MARILAAEGDAEAVRLVADAERYRREVEATGQGNAITTVFGSINAANPTDRLIAIQYIDSLKAIANGTASKVFLPYEATALLGALGGIQEMFKAMPPSDGSAPVPLAPPAISTSQSSARPTTGGSVSEAPMATTGG